MLKRILRIGFLLMSISAFVQAYDGGTELVEQRSFFSRTYLADSGEYVTEIFLQPVCYRDDSNTWQLITAGDTVQQNLALRQYKEMTDYGVNIILQSYGSIIYDPTFQDYGDGYVSGGVKVGHDYGYEYRGYFVMDFASALGNHWNWDINITNLSFDLEVYYIGGNGVPSIYPRLKSGSLPTDDYGDINYEAAWDFISQGGTILPTIDGQNTTYLLIDSGHNSSYINSIANFLENVHDNGTSFFTLGIKGSSVSDGNYCWLSGGDPFFSITYQRVTRPLTLHNQYQNGDELTGTQIMIRNILDSYWTYVTSGNSVDLYRGDSYVEHPVGQQYTYNSQLVQHHHWKNDVDDLTTYDLERQFPMETQTYETGKFQDINTVTLTDNMGLGGQVELSDPWRRVGNGYDQSANYFTPANGTWEVFLGQTIPSGRFYSLRAQASLAVNGYVFSFTNWSASPAGGATFEDETALESAVVFNQDGVGIVANYAPDNALPQVLSGTLMTSGVLYGNVQVTGDLYISDNVAITAVPGTQVQLDPGVHIIVAGQFTLQGTDSAPVVFHGDGAVNDIVIYNTTTPSTFHYTDFDGVVLFFDNAFPGSSVEHCSFYNSDIGISLLYSWVDISLSLFQNNNYGLFCDMSSPKISQNAFWNNNTGMAYYDDSEPLVQRNYLDGGGTGIGLLSADGSRPLLWKVAPDVERCDWTNNTLTNMETAVLAQGYSYPILGYDLLKEPVTQDTPEGYGVCGWNRIFGNIDFDIDNQNPGSQAIYAIGNNWYDDDNPEMIGCEESTIGNTNGAVYWEPTVFGLVGNNAGPSDRSAEIAELEGAYPEAIDGYTVIVEENPNDPYAVWALAGIRRCYKKMGLRDQSLQEMLSFADRNPGTLVELYALDFNVSDLLERKEPGDCTTAQQNIDRIRLNHPNSELEPKLMFQEALIAEYQSNGQGKLRADAVRYLPPRAESKYQELIAKYSTSPQAILAALKLGKRIPDCDTRYIPQGFALYSPYPNPFNPTTTITYELPELSAVKLTIFNLLGREVVELVHDRKPGGIHRALWNGIDALGRPVASGLYIAHLSAKSITDGKRYQQSRKLMLLK